MYQRAIHNAQATWSECRSRVRRCRISRLNAVRRIERLGHRGSEETSRLSSVEIICERTTRKALLYNTINLNLHCKRSWIIRAARLTVHTAQSTVHSGESG